MDRYDARKVTPVEASAKLDGVYARATRDGVFAKSGVRMAVPHVEKRLKRYFRKRPDGALEGELWRRKAGIEQIAGEARRGGDAARKLKLHVFPGQASPPLPFGAVRRVKGHKVKDDAGVQKRLRKALRKGHEGVVVRGADGGKVKLKPEMDREWRVEGLKVGKSGGLKRKTVLTMRTEDGRPFKVQAGGGAMGAKAGDQVTVRYSGLTRSGKPKAAVAVRVRNEKDFSMKHFKTKPELTEREREQVSKDRKALMKGAVLTALGGVAAYGVLRMPKFRNVKETRTPAVLRMGQRGVVTGRMHGPKLPVPEKVKETRTPAVLRMGQRGVVTGRMHGPKLPVPEKVKAPGFKEAARLNNERKGGVKRLVKAAELKRERAYGALKPPSAKRLAKLNPAVRARYERMDEVARSSGQRGWLPSAATAKNTKKAQGLGATGQLSPGEVKNARKTWRVKRQKARQDLLQYREQKNFSMKTQDDRKQGSNGEKLKNAAVAGGALASGGAAVYGARQWGKTNKALRAHADALAAQLTPKEIARQVGAEVGGKAKRTLRGYFPTFIKAGKKVSKVMKTRVKGFEEKPLTHEELVQRYGQSQKSGRQKKEDRKRKRGWLFETPASRLLNFGNAEQWRRESDQRYGSPLKGAMGLEKGYYRKDADGEPIIEALPFRQAQVIKSTYNKAKKVQKYGTRGSGLLKDAGAVVAGRPREKDRAGREKKREWEKPWFKTAARNAAITGAILVGAKHVAKDPEKWRKRVNKHVIRPINRKVPDYLKEWEEGVKAETLKSGNAEMKSFATPAGKLLGKFEKPLRKGGLGKFLGPSEVQRTVAKQRKALAGRVKAAAAKGNQKAAAMVPRVKHHAAMKEAGVKASERRQKDAIRGLKKGAGIAAGGAVLGGAAMKLHADQPEDRKVRVGARFRNALVGAAAGSYLGAGLHTGKSGFRGARLGALAGGLIGAVSNPKRKQVIEDLPVASFAVKAETLKSGKAEMKRFGTPASRLLHFDVDAAMAGWDIRDPRGKSARVYAPGSRRRHRRPKEWHERKENRDKLAAAAVIAAGVGGLAVGTKLGRKLALRKQAAVPSPAPGGISYGPKMGPRSTVRPEGFYGRRR
jgi:hypothetical protein